MKRYTITKSHESGPSKGEFVGADGKPSPLVWEFETFSEAKRHLMRFEGGRGQIVDRQTRCAWAEGLGWEDCSAYLDMLDSSPSV